MREYFDRPVLDYYDDLTFNFLLLSPMVHHRKHVLFMFDMRSNGTETGYEDSETPASVYL